MTTTTRARIRTALVALALIAATPTVPTAVATADPAPPTVGQLVTLSPLQTSADRRIVDADGRDVLLRGANVNSLGEYWQGDPAVDPTVPVTDADWASMQRHGLNVVRLIITWSLVEPTRGTIDQSYLDLVENTVQAAAAHGIYTVIDMHQDAYSAFISTPPAEAASCPPGTSPAKGWDGAPAWAVLTDGLSTCTPGERNASPAVNRAWNHFWDNTDGIRDRFVASWQAVATRFAGNPAVAGFDLLNEPETSRPATELAPLYEAFLVATINGVRQAQAAAGAPFDHIVFVQPAIPAGNPSFGIVIPDPARAGVGTQNIAASVHNYAESIGIAGLDITIEQMNDFILSQTEALGVAHWGGEYGFWDTSEATLAKARRYAATEDASLQGGAWWQWRQSCGDPHAVSWNGSAFVQATGRSTHLNLLDCPNNVDAGPNDAFLSILGRGYPRATPGRLSSLTSSPDTGAMVVRATAGSGDVGRQLIVWTPTAADAQHQVFTRGLGNVTEHAVDGGRLIVATVSASGTYALQVGPADTLGDAPTPEQPGGPTAITPATPAFTG